jgi:uncharacterized protein YbaR (Trm112 family)
MRRGFDVDVLACPRCNGRLRLIGTVEDPDGICQILAGLARSADHVDRSPCRRIDARQPICLTGAHWTLPVRSQLPQDSLDGPLSTLYLGGEDDGSFEWQPTVKT